jgi:hypothetical protein
MKETARMIIKQCEVCSKQFEIPERYARRPGRGVVCSASCAGKKASKAKGESHPLWTGGHKAMSRRYQEKNPEKKYAHEQVRYAIKTGRLAPQPCEVCCHTIVDAHHDDYREPLKVRWLCRTHHAELHRSLNERDEADFGEVPWDFVGSADR